MKNRSSFKIIKCHGSDNSSRPFAGTLALPPRGKFALGARPCSTPTALLRKAKQWGNRARSSSQRPAQSQLESSSSSSRMVSKVFIVIDSLGPGGAQRQIVEYLKCADRDKFLIKVINLDKAYDTLANEITDLGYEIIGIEHAGFLNISTIIQLVKLFWREKPDIVHTYLFTADVYGRLAARFAGVPVIVSSIRGFDIWKKAHHIFVDRFLAGFTQRIIINVEKLRSFLLEKEKLAPEKIIRIYNGIDLSRFDDLRSAEKMKQKFGIPSDALVVGMVARFSEQKDHETFFAAAAAVARVKSNVYFIAVGDGPSREEFEQQLKGTNIIFAGLRRDIPDMINMMDIGVLSSPKEGCPNVVLEYMACSKPAVASDVGGCPELIIDDKTGYVFTPGDSSALSEKLLVLLRNEKKRMGMGRLGRQRVEEEFCSERLARNIEGLYRELLDYKKEKTAFLLSQFPEMHETFILREFVGLEKKGINFEVYSLKKCKDKIIHPEARAFMNKTIYTPAVCLWSVIYWLFNNPAAYFKAYTYCFIGHMDSPVNWLKAQAVFLRSLYFARIMKKRNVKNIHAHWATMPTTAARVVSVILDIPFSFTAHAWDIFLNNRRNLKDKIEKARFVVTCTRFNKNYLDELVGDSRTASKVIVNYHGLDLEKFSLRDNTPRSNKVVFAIGRLVEQKGFEYLIKACGILKRKSMNFKCIIAGDGPLRKDLELLCQNLSLEDVVEFPGMVTQEQVRKWFQEAALFAAPSVISKNGDRDGIPNVILEALAMGVPVVSTDVSGIPEVIINGETGIAVPSRDEKSLAQAIEHVICDQTQQDVSVINGRKKIEQGFDITKTVDSLVEIFR